MLQLRIKQHAVGEDRHRVQISVEGDGARRTAESTFPFRPSPDDDEDLRWYLEDFLQYPESPAPAIARRIEGRMAEMGTELFGAVFRSSDDARDLWAEIRNRLPETRIEIVVSVGGVREATALPWELLRDPKTASYLALTAQAFVRAQPNSALPPNLPAGTAGETGKIRILLVLCRPGAAAGEDDVPFRSVASQLLRGLSEANREAYDLDVLRPPTFEQLGKVLREAHRQGRPYHAVHFDGHGTYRVGRRGQLWFESPQLDGDGEGVDGTSLGQLLKRTGVSILVLNACRSAHAEPASAPTAPRGADDPHSQARAFGSLAQEVMDAGVAGVVAMRYNVYVVTAARLVAELYAALVRGATLGEAVTLARKNLADNPMREVVQEALPLQDWMVPVVYEAAPLQLFPKRKDDGGLKIRISQGAAASAGDLGSSLPPPPDAGFFGRDETLLALDRAFDRSPIVLLHAYAGSGKTTTAAEFARWYSLTGGLPGVNPGPVLFTSFERHLPLARVLDRIGEIFGAALEKEGIHWLALDDATRRQVALQVLAQVPVLWIWDNVEPVTGFPAGTESAWTVEEQEELIGFLRDLRGTKAKILLTSRRDEHAWLGDLPVRVTVPPMPMTESLQLVRALAGRHGRRLADTEDWRPLLAFARGNPMTLTVLAGQALRQGIKTKEQVEAFVASLRTGEAAFSDEAGEGRSRSLGASLAYGFGQAFGEEEVKKLALLHLFQGFVDVRVLSWMGEPEVPWCLPEVRGLQREEAIALLDRAAEVGLLTAHGDGRYGIHPALPWFFKGLFSRGYPEGGPEDGLAATRAFAESVGALGNHFAWRYEEGNRDVIDALRAEEANLLHVRRLGRAHGWWRSLFGVMQGLRKLYRHTGRQAEWKRLVEEIVPDFVDPANDGPLPGREEHWSLVTEYRVHLAEEERQWTEAERLQAACVDWDRRRAASGEAKTIRTLAASLHELGEIRRHLGQADCVESYREALELSERIGERTGAVISGFNLGHAFKTLPALRDLDQAEHWYRRSFGLCDERDRLGRGRCLAQLASIDHERFREAWIAGSPHEVLLRYLNGAAGQFYDALDLLPEDAVTDLALTHNKLGGVSGEAGELGRAIRHFREAIRLDEQAGNLHDAAEARSNVALALFRADRREDALEYAEAALRGFEAYGERAAEGIEKARRLIAAIRG